MVELVSLTRRDGGVTLVEAALVHEGRGPRRVRVESRLEPVWPPRRRGVPVPAWDGGRYAVTLAPGECRGFGFASPAEPVDPPVVLVDDRPPEGEATSAGVSDVVRTLGDPIPPPDAVRTPDPGRVDGGQASDPAPGAAGGPSTGAPTDPGDEAGGPDRDRPGSPNGDPYRGWPP